jgi:ribonuclease P protein component
MSVLFPQSARLRSRAEFDAVQQGGRRVSARFVTLVGRPNARTGDRLGIIASRKIGGAVIRNRAKRRLRELFRKQEPDRATERGLRALDVVVIARREIADATPAALEADFTRALGRLRGAGSQ